MDFFWIWFIRSRGCVILGLGVLVAQHILPDFAAWEYSGIARITAFLLLLFGAIDTSGAFQKEKVSDAIKKRRDQDKFG
jgi:hypothetical protein